MGGLCPASTLDIYQHILKERPAHSNKTCICLSLTVLYERHFQEMIPNCLHFHEIHAQGKTPLNPRPAKHQGPAKKNVVVSKTRNIFKEKKSIEPQYN